MHEAVRSVIDPVNAGPGNKLTRLVAALRPLIQTQYSPWKRRGKMPTSNILHRARLPLFLFPLIAKN